MIRTGQTLSWSYALGLWVAFGVWTALVVTGVLDGIDQAMVGPHVPPLSRSGQILASISIVTAPAVQVAAVLAIAIWAIMRRLRRLAIALIGATLVGWAAELLLKELLRRPRPDSDFDVLFTMAGYGYPAGHLVAGTILGFSVVTIVTVQRRQWRQSWTVRLAGVGFIVVLGVVHWLLRAQFVSGLVGGALLGAAILTTALLDTAARTIPDALGLPTRRVPPTGQRAAVIVNPVKVVHLEMFRSRVEYESRLNGWRPPLWLETTVEDPGYQQTRTALDHGVDLVIVAGGDGTVRAVCSELVGTGVPLGLMPAGTGNLLARNLGIILDDQEALSLAFTGTPTPVDAMRYVTDDTSGYFMVMGGMGADAKLMADTNPELKRAVGAAAYFLTALQSGQGIVPFGVTVTIDNDEPVTREAGLALVGNVGTLQGGIKLFRQADPSDGILDVLVGSAVNVSDWAKVATGIIGGAEVEPLEYARARDVSFTADTSVAYQVDGDALGTTARFAVEVVAGALLVMLPR